MSSIGSETFIKMSDQDIPKLGAAVQIIDRPGVDGTANRTNAFKAEELTKYTLEAVTDVSDANDAIDDYNALKGTKVTVEDDLGRSITDVLVVDVKVIKKQKVLLSSPAGTEALIWAAWLLKPTKK